MNISENLIRIKQGKDDIIKSLQNKGSDISNDTLIDNIPTYIDNLEIGGGGDTPSVPTELVPKYEGASVFRINVPTDNYEFAINLCNNATKATYDVDWGDGNLESGLTTDEQRHTYRKKGIYDVNIYNISKDITLGGSQSEIKNEVSGNSFDFSYLFNNTNNDYWVIGYVNITDLIVISILVGDKITSIGQYAFYGCSSLTSINIPNSVTSIGLYAFYGCSSLTSMTIPDSVTSIATSAFQNCDSLTSMTIPDSVTTINNFAFRYCLNLVSINIPNSVTSIGNSAFQNCVSLTSINIPNSVTSIGSSAFQNCKSLQSIVIPNSVKSISGSAFQNCDSLTSINIPNSVTSIGSSAFSSCTFLQSITCESLIAPTIISSSFPTTNFKFIKRYLYIHKDADIENYTSGNWKTYLIDKGWEIRYIEDMETEKTPTTLKIKTTNNFLHKWDCIGSAKLIDYELVGDEYIYHFDNKITELINKYFKTNVLTSIEIPEGVETLGNSLFYSALSLRTLNIPSSVRTIGNNCFYRVPIQEIIIPEGVEILPQSMCESCSLKNIVIPSTVTTIDNRCFMYNGYVLTITSKAMVAPTIQSGTFNSVGTNVPSGTPKILRIPINSSGYEETTSEWYKQLIAKGYKVEYI